MSDVETDDAKPRRWQHDFLVGVLGDLEALLGEAISAIEGQVCIGEGLHERRLPSE